MTMMTTSSGRTRQPSYAAPVAGRYADALILATPHGVSAANSSARGVSAADGTAERPSGRAWRHTSVVTPQITLVDTAGAASSVSLPAGKWWTFLCHLNASTVGGGVNRGFWRSGAGAAGGIFFILDGAGRPWVRIDGGTILSAASGPVFPTNAETVVAVTFAPGRVSVAWNGAIQYSASHSITQTNNEIVRYIGHQYSPGESIPGDYFSFAFLPRGISDTELASLTTVGGYYRQLFAPVRRPVFFFGPSAGSGTTVSVPVGAVSVAGYAPTVTATANQTISVPVGAVSLAGYAPTISTSASQTVAVPAGAVTLAGYAPTVTATANQVIAVPAGAVSLTGYAPSVFTTAVTTIAVPAGAVSLAGFAPTISYTTHAYIDVPKGAVTLTGYAPTVTGGESSIWTPVTTDSAVWSAQSVSAANWTLQ